MSKPLPVIVGVAQFNARTAGMAESPEPLEMMMRVARGAAEDCNQPDILKSIDAIAVVNIISWGYQNAPAALAEKLGIKPASLVYTSVGGNTPQYLVNHFAEEIGAGKVRTALIAGAEAMHTLRRLMKERRLAWGKISGAGSPTSIGDSKNGTSALEEKYGARLPVQIYPLFENARRAHHGWSISEHRQRLGSLCSSMTQVAAHNPYAWFPQARGPDEITKVTAENRIIGFPYPKLMNAIIDVDMAAALIITSDLEARRLGIPQDKLVYVHSGADATDRWFISERADFHRSPAMEATTTAALESASVGATEINHFDFYSCFPAAVGIALDGLGINAEDDRGVTVTGGLPYFGGPGNNYVTHSIAAMTERLRTNPEGKGLVTALGWYFTKHAAGVYSSVPPKGGFVRANSAELTARAAAGPKIEIEEIAEGSATVETYTVIHDRAGAASEGIVVARLSSGRRFFARAPRETLAAMETEEFVGRRGRVRSIDGLNLFEPL